METLLLLVFSNAVTATLLAAGVACVALKLKRPAVLHILLTVVLLRLFAPPLYDFGVMPALGPGVSVGSLTLNPVPTSVDLRTVNARRQACCSQIHFECEVCSQIIGAT